MLVVLKYLFPLSHFSSLPWQQLQYEKQLTCMIYLQKKTQNLSPFIRVQSFICLK